MATKRTYIDPVTGTVITFNANRTYMSPFGSVISEGKLAAAAVFNAWLTTFNTSANMKKNVAGQSVGAQMITISDGSVFTGSVTVLITIDNGTQSASAGTAPAHEGNGYHSYTPTQAETNGDHIAFTFTGTGAVTQTIQVETTFPQTVDNDILLQLTATATALADVPTVAEFNARTLLASAYFDPAADAVANVTLVATTSLNTDMVAAAPTTAQIWAETTRVLTSGLNIVLAKGIGVTGFNDITAASVLAAGDIDGFTLEEAQKLTLSMGVGVLSGAATSTITIQAADGSKARITATVDVDGNRSAVIKDVTG